MNIFLSLLPEKQDKHEGQGFIKRIAGLLKYSSRHCQADDPAQADVVLFMESNRFKSRHDFASFEKSDLLKRFAHKAYTLNYCDAPIAFLPGLYVCNPRQSYDPSWTRAIPYPWPSPNQQLQTFSPGLNTQDHIVSFRGSMSHPVRHKLLEVMSANPQLGPSQQIHRWFNHTADEQFNYLVEIVNSRFVLCPRGIGTATYRLYESLLLGRVPVIISDNWVPPEDIIWNSCSLRISEKRLDDLPALLNTNLRRWPEMRAAASSAWNNFFSDSVLADFLFDQLESLTYNRLPGIDWSYLQRRWKSPSFRRQNKWDYLSQVKRFYSRI